MIPYSIGDVCDRYSILLLKKERGGLPVDDELKVYKKELDKYPDIWVAVSMLYIVNGNIWSLESDIHLGKEDELGLEEVGRRAIRIREHNKERIGVKNRLNERYGEGFIEIKSKDHPSS